MGTLTITTTPAHDVRLIAAYTKLLKPVDVDGLPRDVTAGEIKDHIIRSIKGVVHTSESQEASRTAIDEIIQIDPT